MASSGCGYAVPILTCENDGKVQVHEGALQEIFLRPKVQKKPVCIVSMSGAFRKGKSFMLNFFIRYLQNKEHVDDSSMRDADVPMMDGFDWRGGRGACTNGILMWSEVFTVEGGDGEVAVILMDTQGLFDHKTDKKTNSIIFALSTLISSVQIFNLSQQIQESDLGFLQFFTEYAKAVRSTSQDKDIKPFQSLTFLVRDWPNPTEFPYGTDGGEKYLEEVLSYESTSEELSSVRKYLRSSFDKAKCCLMPHPGLKVATTSKSFKSCLRDIDDEFLRQTASFVDSLFKPQNLVVKTINGQEMSAPAILQYIYDCSESLADRKLPKSKTMMKSVAEVQNFEAQRRCSEKYTETMKEVIGDSFVDDDVLKDSHDQTVAAVMKEFAEMSQFGSEESRSKHRDYLEATITREYRMLVQVNRSLKVKAESEMLYLTEDIVDKYEKKMKETTEGKEFLSDEDLDEIHEVHAKEARESYAADGNTNSKLKDEYLEMLQVRLDRNYETLKSENEEKRRIAKEQNERTRQMMKFELQCVIQFRENMSKHISHYMEEVDLEKSAETSRRAALDEFRVSAIALNINVFLESEIFQKHLTTLETKLDEERGHIVKINREKKVTLEKMLDNQRNKAIMEYENVFKKVLKDTYLGEKHLQETHKEVVEKLMSSSRSVVGNSSSLPSVQRHLQETEDELDSKYNMVKKWNEKNITFLRKCFKTVATPVAGLIGRLKSFQTQSDMAGSRRVESSSGE